MFRNRTLVALAALVVVGGATLWKITRPDPHAIGPAGEPGAAVYHVAKADVDELEITDPKKGTIDLKKDGAEWKMTAPVADRADQKAVEQALDALDSLKLKQVVAEKPESYDTVGVKDEDVVKIVPKKAGKPLATLLLGKTTNARVEGDPRVFATANLKRYARARSHHPRDAGRFARPRLDRLPERPDGGRGEGGAARRRARQGREDAAGAQGARQVDGEGRPGSDRRRHRRDAARRRRLGAG